MAVIMSKKIALPNISVPVAVTITGTGSTSYAYATVNGTQYTAAASDIEVNAGDTIVFGVYGASSSVKGTVTIDGTTALTATSKAISTYEWTVPEGVSAVAITLAYAGNFQTGYYGTITVTTS